MKLNFMTAGEKMPRRSPFYGCAKGGSGQGAKPKKTGELWRMEQKMAEKRKNSSVPAARF